MKITDTNTGFCSCPVLALSMVGTRDFEFMKNYENSSGPTRSNYDHDGTVQYIQERSTVQVVSKYCNVGS